MLRRYYRNDISLVRALPKISIICAIIASYAILDLPVFLYKIFEISVPKLSVAYGCGAAFLAVMLGLYGLSLQHNDDVWDKRCALFGASIGGLLIGWVGWVLFV
ncbi:MAG: hypothetical protein GY804_07845 [Alphaproteobacteria bacterium]|nr:hypothetical protein [Alphaproteobacteria bacterium]